MDRAVRRRPCRKHEIDRTLVDLHLGASVAAGLDADLGAEIDHLEPGGRDGEAMRRGRDVGGQTAVVQPDLERSEQFDLRRPFEQQPRAVVEDDLRPTGCEIDETATEPGAVSGRVRQRRRPARASSLTQAGKE